LFSKKGEANMTDQKGKIYRMTLLVGTSNTGFDDGVRNAIARAQKTLRHIDWFEIKEQRGKLTDNGIEYQVIMEVGFLLEEP
jgi:flavin-binding protein dodecin